MKNYHTHGSTWLAAAVFVTASLVSIAASGSSAPSADSGATQAQPATASQAPQPPTGHYLFRTYCASCHGTSGMGDGSLAASLRHRPANLTEIAKRNGGTYPSELVFKVIDGRQQVRGHGGPDMPVWGDAFARTIDTGGEASVKLRIEALVAYLESIQVRLAF